MHLFINSLAGTAGGGLTYIRNVIPHLAVTSDLGVTIALPPGLCNEFSAVSNVEFLEMEMPTARRFWYEQSRLSALLRQCRADVLLSAGNFALRNSPVPQILLSRNSIYTSPDFFRDLRLRHEYRTWLDTHFRAQLAKRSTRWADITVAPSEAFAAQLRRWAGVRVRAIHHGFDHEAFTRDSSPLPGEVEKSLQQAEGSLKVLFVSHYNYYRNFETLLRALPILRQQLPGRGIKLLLTCKLRPGENPGTYDPEAAASLVRELGISEMVVELGSIPYRQLHHLYSRADIYVTPAYTETFAHPLVEAMASGIPVLASDIAVHREICGEAAVYFPRFSPEELAARIAEVANSPEEARNMAALGLERAGHFSWKEHVKAIVGLADDLVKSKNPSISNRRELKEYVA